VQAEEFDDAPARPADPGHSTTKDFVRYVMSGATAFIVDFGLFSSLIHFAGMDAVPATIISRPVGGLVSFLLHKFFTFQNRGAARTHEQFVRFIIVWIASYGVSTGLVALYSHGFDWNRDFAKIAAEGGAGLFSFLCQRHWTFSHKR
jgi:putative flippase GtrA